MGYLALYRKYRPKTFDEVYGQTAIVQTLRNQIKSNRIGHAYLFCGPRGTGKTTLAKIFAKAINCSNHQNGNPCLQCECCTKTNDGLNIDIIEIDAASNNGVDNIRSLIEESKYMPQYGKYKVYIIDEVHMLSSSAFNALLKTLEEPVPNVVFILATTEHYKVPATISSRCQRYQFTLISNEQLVLALKGILSKENVSYEEEALLIISKLAKGGLRDALSLLDQTISLSNCKKITSSLVKEIFGELEDDSIMAMVNCISNQDVSGLLDIFNKQIYEGKNMPNICNSLYEYYKNEYLYNSQTDAVFCQRAMRIMAELSDRSKTSSSRTIFEIALIKLCKPQMETDYSSLHQRINILEKTIEQLLQGNINIQNKINDDEFLDIYVNACSNVQTEVYYI